MKTKSVDVIRNPESEIRNYLVAQDYSGNATTNNFQVVVNDTVGQKTLTYDDNGNLTGDGDGKTFEYDAEDRCVAINEGTHRTEMTYDGWNQRVKIVEKENSEVVSTKRFLWVGNSIAEERNSDGDTVTKRYFPQGMTIVSGVGSGNYYYCKDHLGSIRELTDSNQAVRGRWDYDPYGRRSENLITSNPVEADFGFTGYYVNAQYSNLAFPKYRIYDSDLGRFIGYDPIGERGGLNLYAYVMNDPINWNDPMGLWPSGRGQAHQNSINRVLLPLSNHERDILARQQVTADKDNRNRVHAMRDPGQSVADAKKLANDYVRSEIEKARKLDCEGKHDEALRHVGNAMHALQDAISPAHASFQEWNGYMSLDAVAHGSMENYDPGAGSPLDRATSDAYDYYTGATPMPDDFF